MGDNEEDGTTTTTTTSWDSSSCLSSSRSSLCDVLRSLIINNIEHFDDGDETDGGGGGGTREQFYRTFGELLEHLNAVEEEVNRVARFAFEYDFDPSVPGNGHRSFVAVFDAFVVHSIRLCRQVCLDRGSSFIPSVFRRSKQDMLKEVTAHVSVFSCLRIAMRHLNTLRSWSEAGSLFPSPDHSAEELLIEAGDMDTSCFYGQCLGFQFSESMRKSLKFVSLAMASFSDAYYNEGRGVLSRTASSLISCGRYAYYPEERAKRIVSISHRASVHFCKAFWLLQENYFLQQVPGILCPQLVVNRVLQLPVERLRLPKHSGSPIMCDIPIPSSHFAPAPVICRLLSACIREGQVEDAELGKHSVMPKSPCLIIQVHGGGFVAQSSKSHEVYLRDWAAQLNVPILCVDYSLAPEAPFPRPLEECLYAYAWAIKNCHSLGSTGEKICLVGDSAGGNLILGVTMKAIELGVRRPDYIFALYTPVLIDFVPSPSRLLCLMDPLLPFGFMLRCLQAYAGLPMDDVLEDSLSSNSESKIPATKLLSEKPAKADVKSVSEGVGIGSKYTHSDSESFEEVSPSEVFVMDQTLVANSDIRETTTTTSAASDAHVKPELSVPKDYASNFVDWYILDVDESHNVPVLRSSDSTCDSDENVLFEIRKELPRQITEKVGMVADRVMDGISGLLPNKRKEETEMKERATDYSKPSATSQNTPSDDSIVDRKLGGAGTMRRLIEEFHKIKVDRSHYLSPYLAPDDLLKQLPPTRFLTLQLDPCLDDAVMMCKRLRGLGVRVDLDIVDNLPHGFLNFAPVSKDAHSASRLCVQRLREMLQLPVDIV